MTYREKEFLEKRLDNIYILLDKLPNKNIEGSTEYKILNELEKINSEFDVAYLGKYL